MIRFFLVGLCALMLVVPQGAQAEAQRYVLDGDRSEVAFFYKTSDVPSKGVFPVKASDIRIEWRNVARSSVDVTIDTGGARVFDPIAALALKSRDFLDTARYPEARFVSRDIRRAGDTARVSGDLTLKGVTRPVNLEVAFQRLVGAPEDNSEIILRIRGGVSRAAFGITAYPEVLEDIITLDFSVFIRRVD
ncbi:YceI family protein [Shimia sp. SDUM112013]|uniref:YceI family protein n=1 Tax=Shimia sp. SDUM112013 TaxID=3136160 RepID=UPI0032EC9599